MQKPHLCRKNNFWYCGYGRTNCLATHAFGSTAEKAYKTWLHWVQVEALATRLEQLSKQ